MGSTLFNTTPQNTYPSLIKIGDNLPLSGTLKVLSDGNGNDSVLALSTISLQIGGATGATWDNTNKRLGIGTTTPSQLLDVQGNSAAVRVSEVGGAEARFVSGGSSSFMGTYSNHPLIILTDSAERMRITSAGNVGIGTTSPNIYATGGATNIVSIQATGTDAGAILDIAGTGTGFSGINMGNATIRRAFLGTIDGGNFGIYTNPTNTGTVVTERLTITAAGNVGIGTATPTATLNIKATGSNNSDNLAQVLTNSELRLQYRADDVSSLYIGGLGSERGYLQGINNTQNAGADISLNPYGGNVGIGTTSPTSKLQISAPDALSSWDSALPLVNVTNLDQSNGQGFALLARGGALDANCNIFEVQDYSANSKFVVKGLGNVGIGTSTPTTKLMVEGTGSFGTVSNEIRLQNAGTFVSSTLNAHLINSDGTGAYTSGNLLIQPRCSSGAGVTNIVFATSNNTNTPTERFRITADGVTFNGDTAAANALDDYEEGTWTMGVSFGGGSTGITYVNNRNLYQNRKTSNVNGYLFYQIKEVRYGCCYHYGIAFCDSKFYTKL
jgi:hypothetical protein